METVISKQELVRRVEEILTGFSFRIIEEDSELFMRISYFRELRHEQIESLMKLGNVMIRRSGAGLAIHLKAQNQ